MKVLDIDFTQKPKLLINDVEYNFNQRINAKDHIFNNAGSTLELTDVYPLSYTNENLRTTPVKLPRYSLGEFYFGDKLFYFGILKAQQGGSLMPNMIKKINVSISTLKEFLIHEPMDFAIVKKQPEFVVDKVIEKLGISYVAKGNISFENKNIINSYNTKDMTAWDTLKFIERHTDSTLVISLDPDNKRILINYKTKESIKSASAGNKGIDIPFDTEANITTFTDLYEIKDFIYEQNESQTHNSVRVESEKSISNRGRKIEINLTQDTSTFTLQNAIGKVDRENTKYLDSNGDVIRKLLINTTEQEANKRPTDISFTPDNDTININPRLYDQNPNSKIVFAFFPVVRQNIDFEDATSQQEIAARLQSGKGRIFRYEKFNDLTSLEDLISQGKGILELGIADKLSLKITTATPIWDLGQHVEFFGGDDIYKDFSGEYITTDLIADMIVDSETGLRNASFIYTLKNIKNVQSEINFFDSQSYRDNPIIESEELEIDVSTTISESITLETNTLTKTCIPQVTQDNQLDYELDFDLGIEINNNEPIWKI